MNVRIQKKTVDPYNKKESTIYALETDSPHFSEKRPFFPQWDIFGHRNKG